MRIAVISDIHDNVWKLSPVLAFVHDTDALVCLGDLCSPFVVHQLGREYARPIHVVFGNNDGDLFRIAANARGYEHLKLDGEFWSGEFGGRRVAAHHFDNIARPLAASGDWDALFFGHNHRFHIGQAGRTLLVNPGPVMGAAFAANGAREDVPSSFAIYDSATNTAAGYQVLADGTVAPW